jgi:hypothetical protein
MAGDWRVSYDGRCLKIHAVKPRKPSPTEWAVVLDRVEAFLNPEGAP